MKTTETDHVTRMHWLDYLKGLAMVWIFINHLAEQLFGSPYIANPTADWAAFGDRLRQLTPLSGYGLLDVPFNALRYGGWLGDQGVQLFIILSGFGLTWGLLQRGDSGPLNILDFYRRRLNRIYPMWWMAHLLFLAGSLLVPGWGFLPFQLSYYLSLIGIRFTPATYYYLAPAWWYFGLLVQLYLVYPLLWRGLQRVGPANLLLFSVLIALPIRALGLLILEDYLDPWSRGAIFITRLPEFAFGISLAVWLFRSPQVVDHRLRQRSTLALAGIAYGLGLALALTLLGMTFALLLTGVGVFILGYAALRGLNAPEPRGSGLRGLTWIGSHSYSVYLVHHPIILLVLPAGIAPDSARALSGLLIAAVLTWVGALLLEGATARSSRMLAAWVASSGILGTGLRLIGIAVVAIGGAVGAELAVRQFAPQEVNGWGERPALQPHAQFGWNLIPSTRTRLRWESYDYTVTANALGFPGPDPNPESPPGVYRIMTVGDAFTSAEGVDTEQAWPRLLEDQLNQPGSPVEVLNFAITGYGPNQTAAVIEAYAPQYQPQLIIIGMFVNDYEDVLLSNEEFQTSIGFEQRPASSWQAVLSLASLRAYIRLHIYEPLSELWSSAPRQHGYFLGNFAALERNNPEYDRAVELVSTRMAQIRAVADQIGAEVLIVMIPAPVQVCDETALAYYPRHVDLNDAERYDPDLPQRLTQQIARETGVLYHDLRPVLRASDQCPYMARNMHWRAIGHELVAEELGQVILNIRGTSP